MPDNLNRYLDASPEIVFEWSDKETEARAWLVINSLKGGAAGGGTRMRKGLTRKEVEDLAKTMEVKFSVCGPAIGGAKSGIDFDPSDPRKEGVLKRWFQAVRPLLKSYYGTAGDLNVDEKTEVSPLLKPLGIIHPQEGVLEGHFKYAPEIKKSILDRLTRGCQLNVRSEKYSPAPNSDLYTTIDLITGYGVAESVRIFYHLYKSESLHNKRAYIQGWGNVGAAAGWYLSKMGVRIILIQDREGYIVNENGFSFEEITEFMNNKKANTIQHEKKFFGALPNELLNGLNLELFIPAAASKLVKPDFIDLLIDNGLQLISCGANVPFEEEGNLFGALSRRIDQKISLIPDFIANCGVARLFAYLMENKGPIDEDSIFKDVSNTINTAIQKILDRSKQLTGISQNAWNNSTDI